MINYNTIQEVLDKAKLLIGRNLSEILSSNELEIIKKQYLSSGTNRKGRLGQIIEEVFFQINPGMSTHPDFQEINLELKVTPLKLNRAGLSAKERLVLSMIDYLEIIKEEFKESKFIKKNNNLLIIFYLYEPDKSVLDYRFLYIYLLDLSKNLKFEDYKIIEEDWNKIKTMVMEGKAHLLTERLTKILGPCTKSSSNKTRREQPNNKIKAKPRAYSIKSSFITKLIREKISSNNDTNFIGTFKTTNLN